ncbi:class I SAM-dependent methyltransferase [Nocardia amamiensis]|uniref:class I SAM-dependent methyltransferase n=1 Tax=Nocardia TaxID=1817 RepID=UPI0033FC7C06
MTDIYAGAAEFYDLVAGPLWARKGPVLAAALRTARTDLGPIVDIGAGTGCSTEVIADALPGAAIVAVEPSPCMRIALSARVALRGLADRVTIAAATAGDFSLPQRIGGAVVYGVLGHIEPPQRTRLLADLAERLPPGAPVVVELMDETAPPSRAPLRIARTPVGDHIYEVWSRGSGSGTATMWTLTYRVLHDHRVIREVEVPMPWAEYGLSDLREEAERSNMRCLRIAPDTAVLTHRN